MRSRERSFDPYPVGLNGKSVSPVGKPLPKRGSGLMILCIVKPTAEEWTERHLVTWCAWKHGWYGPDGLPTAAAAGENYSTLDRDSELAYDKLDNWIAESVEHVIEGLPPAQKAAIYRAYDVVAAFQFPRGNYQELLKDARVGVMAGLKRRGVWLGE